MATRYLNELSRLNEAYQSALRSDITRLSRLVDSWFARPMMMVGSGGSYSTASLAAYLHEMFTGRLARAATPLEVINQGVGDSGVACFTASGRNRDIAVAFKVAALSERNPLAALVLSDDTPLHKLSGDYAYSNVVSFSSSAYRDGFLAVASLLASSILLIRAYRAVVGANEQIPSNVDGLLNEVASEPSFEAIVERSEFLNAREYMSVLHSPSLHPAAVDLESRFVEASLGALHVADLRNFGHGRHFWMTTRAAQTGVLALIGDGESTLADRTLGFLPDSVDVQRIDFQGPLELQAIVGLIVSLHFAAGAGLAAGIDPGKPGVPKFGRDLYRLGPKPRQIRKSIRDQQAALARKQRSAESRIDFCDPDWLAAYAEVVSRLKITIFCGVVFDYDGTLCDPQHRYDPVPQIVADELNRLCSEGAAIGIATGRGPSAGEALRAGIDSCYWDKIKIGYYNGAVITTLSDVSDPLVRDLDSPEWIAAMNGDRLFRSNEVRSNEKQISVKLATPTVARHAVSIAQSIALSFGAKVRVVTSSHSIDILLAGQSKTDVVDAVRVTSSGRPDLPILRIGDRGLWPGNDAELLDDEFGLTVDEASPKLEKCWGLAPAGSVGLQATMYYLRNLRWGRKGGRLRISNTASRSAR